MYQNGEGIVYDSPMHVLVHVPMIWMHCVALRCIYIGIGTSNVRVQYDIHSYVDLWEYKKAWASVTLNYACISTGTNSMGVQ